MGLSITALAAASSIAEDDVFEIEQPGVSKKLTKTQLAALLKPTPTLFAGLPAASSVGDTDLFVTEQAGVIKKLTRVQLIAQLNLGFITVDQTILKQNGDVVYHDGSNYVTGPTPRWRVVHQNAYTEAAGAHTSSTITFAGGGPTGNIYLKGGDYFSVGSPVRTVIAGLSYYGICTAVTDTLLTIAGAALPTATAITSLSVGTSDMIKHVSMRFAGTSYNASTTLVLMRNCQYYWRGATGYLVEYACSHMNTSAGTIVQLQVSGGAVVSSVGVTPGAGTATTYGAWVSSRANPLTYTAGEVTDNSTIYATTPTIVGLADYLIICMTFVVP